MRVAGGAVTFSTEKDKLTEPIVSPERSVLMKIKHLLGCFFVNIHGQENLGMRKHTVALDLEKSEVAKAI